MKRRTLDVIFSIGGLLLAALVLVLGLVLQNQANFAKNYVTDQLTAQRITFTAVDKLTEEEKNEPGAQCLQTYAGQQLTTGNQAECYANKYIALHLGETALLRPGLAWAVLALYVLFEAALHARPCRAQI